MPEMDDGTELAGNKDVGLWAKGGTNLYMHRVLGRGSSDGRVDPRASSSSDSGGERGGGC